MLLSYGVPGIYVVHVCGCGVKEFRFIEILKDNTKVAGRPEHSINWRATIARAM